MKLREYKKLGELLEKLDWEIIHTTEETLANGSPEFLGRWFCLLRIKRFYEERQLGRFSEK